MTAILLLSLALAADPAEGIRPLGADGKPLNLDFETGTLQDWTAAGEAFKNQPVKGDTVAKRRLEMKSNHQGEYWIGTFEGGNKDKPTGTLTSAPFKVTHPWASFLLAGGSGANTRVEIILAPKGEVIRQAHGSDKEDMARTAVDLAKYVGQTIQIRLVDEASGGWGHINFDDFRFHADEPKNIQQQASPPFNLQEVKNAGLSPEKAAAAMTVPEGFSVSLFAGEPDIHQPIAFCFDDRGRLWVVEAYTYPKRNKHPGPILPDAEKDKGDKVLIFEDTNGDGKFDKRTVFIEGLNLVSGIEYGFGGIYIGAAPYLLHIPVKDDKPAGEPVILLDGWGYEDTHETLNSFLWGPDGWLYGCHGVFTHSKVGKPGTPEKDRVKINAGVWRFHPTRKVFEVFAHGTSNPWGLDYNQHGDLFVEACVIPHLFHIVQGGRYHRQAGEHFNPYTYIDIPTIADHLHFIGNQWNEIDRKRSQDSAGGHAHCGLMCYQGGAWPKEYHGQLFMGNIHGRRINMDTLHPKGSTYVAKHGKDFLLANDAWARFIAMKYGPDGNAFVIDWYDKQACHRTEPEIWDRTNGRIYKISYRGTKPVVDLDLQKCRDDILVSYQNHENEWYVQHARRILQERVENEKIERTSIAELISVVNNPNSINTRLRNLWCAYCIGALDQKLLQKIAISSDDPVVRLWALALQAESFFGPLSEPDQREAKSSVFLKTVENSLLRNGGSFSANELRVLATAAAQMPLSQRLGILRHIVRSTESTWKDDSQLQQMAWYAMQPMATHDAQKLLDLAEISNMPDLLQLSIRCVGATGTPESLQLIINRLGTVKQSRDQLTYLHELKDVMLRRPGRFAPAEWATLYSTFSKSDSPEIREAALAVAVTFHDPNAMETYHERLLNSKLSTADRTNALQLLIDVKDAKLDSCFEKLMHDSSLRSIALRAMASLGRAESPKTILGAYSTFSAAEKRDAIATLASKPAFALALLDAIAEKKIPTADVPAETIRQLRNFKDKAINDKVVAVWGTLRDTPADRKKLMTAWRAKLTLTHDPDLSAGRAVFAKTCAQCHTLFGVGSNIGPDITGSNRNDLNYLLENIFDPSAIVPKEYAATSIELADGRKLLGIVKEDGAQITFATATETLRFPKEDVLSRKPSDLSMMPDDLIKPLTETEVKNLFWYLRSPIQVPMKATADNAKDLFNGKDLTGWDGDKELWSVENGEIVGKSAKNIPRNSFLKSALEVSDFKLSLKVKLVPNSGNSGIQFRSKPVEGGEMLGPQADIGQGWWGKLYEESGRGLLVKEGGEKHVKKDDWNDYAVEAKGPTVKIWINGNLVADYTDEKLSKKGVIAVQAHNGPPMEVRFKDLKLEVIDK